MAELVRVEITERVAWLTLNRPEKRNAMSPAMNTQIMEALRELENDDRFDVLALTGEGDAFSAGMDLREFFRANDDNPVAAADAKWTMRQWAYYQLRWFPKPTIAAVNGWCFGGAFTPLISCDLAIAADDATFGLSEVNWGIIPAGSVTWDLGLVMREKDALYYIMTGKPFSADRAREIGLVNEVVPHDQLRSAVMELAGELKKRNPAVLRTAKEAYRRVRGMDYEQAFDYLMAKMAELRMTDPEQGRAKGLSQFLDEKRIRPGLEPYERTP